MAHRPKNATVTKRTISIPQLIRYDGLKLEQTKTLNGNSFMLFPGAPRLCCKKADWLNALFPKDLQLHWQGCSWTSYPLKYNTSLGKRAFFFCLGWWKAKKILILLFVISVQDYFGHWIQFLGTTTIIRIHVRGEEGDYLVRCMWCTEGINRLGRCKQTCTCEEEAKMPGCGFLGNVVGYTTNYFSGIGWHLFAINQWNMRSSGWDLTTQHYL